MKVDVVDHSVPKEVNHTICCRFPNWLITAAVVVVEKEPAGENWATSQVVDESVIMAG
jgi:hypothetical protein